MNLEDELRAALMREPAPAGFGDRVLAKTRGPAPGQRNARALPLALAAVLTLIALIPAGVSRYHQTQLRRGLAAREQLITALGITKARLRHTTERLRSNTRHTL